MCLFSRATYWHHVSKCIFSCQWARPNQLDLKVKKGRTCPGYTTNHCYLSGFVHINQENGCSNNSSNDIQNSLKNWPPPLLVFYNVFSHIFHPKWFPSPVLTRLSPEVTSLNGGNSEIKQQLFSSSPKTETIQEKNSLLTSYTRVDISYLPKACAGVPQTFLQKWVIAEQNQTAVSAGVCHLPGWWSQYTFLAATVTSLEATGNKEKLLFSH